jgi:hypothetical protein
VIAAGSDSFCIAANRDSSSLEIATAGWADEDFFFFLCFFFASSAASACTTLYFFFSFASNADSVFAATAPTCAKAEGRMGLGLIIIFPL